MLAICQRWNVLPRCFYSVLAISLTLLDIAICSRNKSLSGRKTAFENKIHMSDDPHRDIPANPYSLVKKILRQNKIYHFFKSFWKWHIALGHSSMLLTITGLLCYFLQHLSKEKAFPTDNIWQKKKKKNPLREVHYFEHRLVGNKLQNKFSHTFCLDSCSQEWCLFSGLCHFTSRSISVPSTIKEKK